MAKTREWVEMGMFRAIIIRSETSVWEEGSLSIIPQRRVFKNAVFKLENLKAVQELKRNWIQLYNNML